MHKDTRVTEIKKIGGFFVVQVSNGIRKILSAYSHQFNLQNDLTGALFRPKTKAKCLTDEAMIKESGLSTSDYVTKCFHYIHNNPVVAGLVSSHEKWKWSSYRF